MFIAIPVKVGDRSQADLYYQMNFEIRRLSKAARLKNALTALGICWAASIAFVFIPVLHFFLVPASFIFGIYLFFQKYNETEYCAGASLVCPKCKAALKVKAGPVQWPLRDLCANCRTDIVINLV